MIISKLNREEYEGKKFVLKYLTKGYYDIEKTLCGFTFTYKPSCNENAISFYEKNGFEIIGFDLFAYTNNDPERHEIRIEMGKFL